MSLAISLNVEKKKTHPISELLQIVTASASAHANDYKTSLSFFFVLDSEKPYLQAFYVLCSHPYLWSWKCSITKVFWVWIILQNCYIFYSIEKLALAMGFLPVYFTHDCVKVSFKHSILDQMVMMEFQQFFCHLQVWVPALNKYSRHSPPPHSQAAIQPEVARLLIVP